MSDDDPNKTQKELLESLKKMLGDAKLVTPSPQTEKVGEEEEVKKKKKREDVLKFELKPKDVKKYLDRFVIQQDEAKRVLSTAVCEHYRHVKAERGGKILKNYAKQNVLILGPTGVGKTYLVRNLANLIGVPFVKADATKFSETGYVGGDVDDMVRELVHKAGGDVELAEYGIIYLDEVDKIATGSNLNSKDVSGTGVQRGLLKIMEETEVPLRNPQDLQSQMQSMFEFQQKGKMTRPTINTRNILFIVSGAFPGLSKIIQKREKGKIGFGIHQGEEATESTTLRHVKTEDLIDFGYEPEFVGRLPVRVVCDPLTAQDLHFILTHSEGSVLRQHEAAFEAYDIEMKATDEALWEIAKRAQVEQTGARGLVTICENLLRPLKYELPSSQLKEFTLTKEVVSDSEKALVELLKDERKVKGEKVRAEIEVFAEQFKTKHGIQLKFSEEARAKVLKLVLDTESDTQTFLEGRFQNYGYGLELIHKMKPREYFEIPVRAIDQPNEVLEKWIKESYDQNG